MTKTAFSKTEILFTSQMDSNLAKKPMTFGTKLCVVLKIGHCGKQIRNSFKCGAEEGWRSVGPIR